ncbi:4012_t:CDS:2 [Gigaspora margarita]|uniref:4012_t:CDS:1 n=1 Tax=Gigaspora margarita TaxID=4874 RepID=A0ABM8W0Z0_GIGMA|nr:4012_t:CDS:2 [Gigaspora margarita]
MTNTLLSTYRQLLKEINKQVKEFVQFTSQNNNQYWKQQLIEAFRKNKDITNIEVSQRLNQDAQDVLSFLRSNRRHNVHFTIGCQIEGFIHRIGARQSL